MRRYPIDTALAESVHKRRIACNLSQNRLALAAKLTESVVMRFETLRYGLSPDSQEAIMQALAEAEKAREEGTLQ